MVSESLSNSCSQIEASAKSLLNRGQERTYKLREQGSSLLNTGGDEHNEIKWMVGAGSSGRDQILEQNEIIAELSRKLNEKRN